MILERLFRRRGLPPGFPGELAAEENVLAVATVAAGGHVVITSLGLRLPEGRRIGWDLVSKATWGGGVLSVVEAEVSGAAGGAVLLADRPPVRIPLADPGRVPETVHTRVSSSIHSRHHRELPGGGAWFVQRRVPGRDGIVLQVRPDPGTDPAAVATVAAEVARRIAELTS